MSPMTRVHRSGPATRWMAAAAVTALGAGTVRARRRLAALPVLEPAPAQDAPRPPLPGWHLITAPGVTADAATLRAAADHAVREGLRVVDLIPVRLEAESVLGLLRLLDPTAHRTDRCAPGHGAGHALLVADDVHRRAGLDAATPPRSAADLLRLVRTLKEYAPDATGWALAPGLTGPPPDPARHAEELRARGLPPALLSTAQLAGLALLVKCLVSAPRWGVAATALYWLQPAVVLGPARGPRPAGVAPATALRPLRALSTALRTLATPAVETPGAVDAPGTAGEAARRAAYTTALAGGTDRFFEPRRTDCPWCSAPGPEVRLRTPDLLQGKPGRFTLEECRQCGHIFQNPRLTPDGLDFYYRDFYEGLGGDGTALVLGRMSGTYRARAELLRPFTTPRAWLDVGTAAAHFCNAARSVWPDTRFDGLDMGDGVHEAARRGWIDTAYQGQFPDLADRLAGRYDTVSMHHYLEHTRDPFAELDAAVKVLAPGGHLLIELPDPESRAGRLLGRYWLPWFQPQHQHLMPVGNLKQALSARGFTVLAEQHGAAHQPNGDFLAATVLAANRLAPDPRAPWSTVPATPARRAARSAVQAMAVPCYAAALVLDGLRTAVARVTDGGNAYRLLARKELG
ncbi:Methyltransferase domain-containing protein [Streptomyces sp. KS_16]|nr:methyltransferase family protein [Streptomyces sp. 2321.6]SDQ86964.1 Methyltransferase domain-containing protein [Streptomyces sp. KS_16]SED96221.1 Methyltransferase domain-containing protein [Streptomyces sp. 2133.1]SNC73249.1 Methyltransferase domain-containing protein [Streptomyces sp. 2114.4]